MFAKTANNKKEITRIIIVLGDIFFRIAGIATLSLFELFNIFSLIYYYSTFLNIIFILVPIRLKLFLVTTLNNAPSFLPSII